VHGPCHDPRLPGLALSHRSLAGSGTGSCLERQICMRDAGRARQVIMDESYSNGLTALRSIATCTFPGQYSGCTKWIKSPFLYH
jgi:hypothetical protein